MAQEPDKCRILRPALLIFLLLCTIQLLWVVAEYGAARHAMLEQDARNPGAELTASLRHEVDSAERHLAIVRAQAEVVLKERARERVDEAVAVAQAIHDQASPDLPPDAVKALVREALRSPRFFSGRGYYFIDDMDGNCVLLPTVPQLEGTSLVDNRDDAGRYIMRELIHAVSNPSQAGYVRYSWYPPNVTDHMDDKIAYARIFTPFNWLIGTGDYASAVEDGLKADALERLRALRLPAGGRLAVIDQNSIVRLSPQQPTLEGNKLDNLPDGPDTQALRAVWQAARSGGATSFTQAVSDGGRLRTWFAWSQADPTFNWVVAAMAAGSEQDASAGRHDFWRGIGRFLLPGLLMLIAIGGIVGLLASTRTRSR